MNRKLFLILCLLTVMGSVGCAKTPPSAYYLLEGIQQGELAEPLEDVRIGVGPVSLPGYLDRSQIVTRTDAHAMTIHEYERWGDSLQRQVENTLAGNLSSLLQTPHVVIYPWERALRPQYQVFVTLRRFEGNSTSGTTIDAIWQIVDVATDASLLTGTVTTTVPVSGHGMEGYVASQSAALETLSRDIAAGIRRVKQQAPS